MVEPGKTNIIHLGTESERETVSDCPWCGSENYSNDWGGSECKDNCEQVLCECGLIYLRTRYTLEYLRKYYDDYQEQHEVDEVRRKKMYQLEYSWIRPYLSQTGKLRHLTILDVGCGDGSFAWLCTYFLGTTLYGVEVGKKAREKAERNFHHVWSMDLTCVQTEHRFDLIIFRGSIEHMAQPRETLDKAISLLKDNGMIFITSTPNSDCIAAKVFGIHWNQHKPKSHLMHFKPKLFDEYFRKNGFKKLGEKFFYEETPYADVKPDICTMAYAIENRDLTKNLSIICPPFYGTLMTLLYRKGK